MWALPTGKALQPIWLTGHASAGRTGSFAVFCVARPQQSQLRKSVVLNAAAVESGPIAADGSYGVFSLDYDISNVRTSWRGLTGMSWRAPLDWRGAVQAGCCEVEV